MFFNWGKERYLKVFHTFYCTVTILKNSILQIVDWMHFLNKSYDPTRVVVVLLSEKKLLRRNTCPTLTTRRMMASPIDQ